MGVRNHSLITHTTSTAIRTRTLRIEPSTAADAPSDPIAGTAWPDVARLDRAGELASLGCVGACSRSPLTGVDAGNGDRLTATADQHRPNYLVHAGDQR